MQAHVYALKGWTIKKVDQQFYIATTAQSRKHNWRGPYASLQRATTAIARKLQWEFIQRHSKAVQP
jgi:hypothetical protein